LLIKLSHGILIVFEGIDGSGKTTQIIEVSRFLRKNGFQVTITHEPNHDSPYYLLIKNRVKQNRDQVSPEDELEWYINDRKWDLENNILPALNKNHIVLVDRYYMSNAAYQGALNAFTPEYVIRKNSFARKPDLWIILDLPVAVGQARLKKREKQYKDQLEIESYQEKVRQNYIKIASMDIGGRIEIIDASVGEKELTENIIARIMDFIREFEK
jgi:dTMP kinase